MIETIGSLLSSQAQVLSSFSSNNICEQLSALTDRITDFSTRWFEKSAFFVADTCRSFQELKICNLLFDAPNAFFALAILSSCSSDELEDVLEQSESIITNEMSVLTRLCMMAAIARMSANQRRHILGSQQQRLPSNRGNLTRVAKEHCLNKWIHKRD